MASLSAPARTVHFAAMVLIGDGVMAIVQPAKAAEAWKGGPRMWRQLMRSLARRPGLTRFIGVVQIAGGVLWAVQQSKRR